jgi:hypothetical protein
MPAISRFFAERIDILPFPHAAAGDRAGGGSLRGDQGHHGSLWGRTQCGGATYELHEGDRATRALCNARRNGNGALSLRRAVQ